MLKIGLVLLALTVPIANVFAESFASFGDGGRHIHRGESVSVKVSNHSTVDVVDHSNISHLRVFDVSTLSIAGGNVSHLTLEDESQFTFYAGTISHLNVVSEGKAILHGGTSTHVRAGENATIEIFDGDFGHVSASGAIDFVGPVVGMSAIDIFGGNVGVARPEEGGTVRIFGGTIGILNPFPGGVTNLFGGEVDHMWLNQGTVTNVYGSALELTFSGEHIHGTPQYLLTGILEDGSSILAEVSLDVGAELNLLPVPEPNGFCLLAGAACCLISRNRLGGRKGVREGEKVSGA